MPIIGNPILIGGGETSGKLPKKYFQRVEYIRSTGSQYIDTNIVPTNSNWGFDIDFITHNSISSSSSSYGTIFGKREASQSSEFSFSTYAQTSTGCFRIGSSNYAPKLSTGVRLHASLRNRIYTAPDNSTLTVTDTNLTNRALTIFALRTGSSIAQYGKVTLFGLKLFDENDELVADYVPCYRKSDSEIGLFDIISMTFRTNDGSGTFESGPEVYA